MRLKSDPVTGSKTQSWLRLCRKIKDNSRFITAPFRETKAFEKLYNQRTSVERTFGDLKDNYNLDNIRVAKMARAKVFMDLSCIALIASRLPDAASKEKTTKIVQIYHFSSVVSNDSLPLKLHIFYKFSDNIGGRFRQCIRIKRLHVFKR